MEMIGFLILFPLVIAGLLVIFRQDKVRNVIVWVASLVIMGASIAMVAMNIGTTGTYYMFDSAVIDWASIAISVIVGAVVIFYSVKYRRKWVLALAAIQLVGTLVFEFGFAHDIVCLRGLYVDSLSLIMTLIIGLVGSGICIYSIGYMEDFQAEHKHEADRRPRFFALMFIFLAAMYAIIFCNNMIWLYAGWEITTVCSFLLIGYTRTEEAIANAFRQIIMNMVGGIAFLAALFYMALQFNTVDFLDFIVIGTLAPALVVFPLTCLSLAGMTKAAQMPFHTWLLGAMVAPTPTSALLHSSTMVKAGVFMLIKCGPIYAVSFGPSIFVILVGGLTFLFCSFLAISQVNAKRVLAYSTIANLGLITACAGVGTAEAIWAAIFLVIFHAIAKSLLFLCVGTAEHHIGSRNIEDMDSLFERMPRLARLMMLGIMIMFIAPFGMLIAKWATLVTLIGTRQIALILMLAFGSAATFMFWAKWLGKLAGIAGEPDNVEITVHKSEWFADAVMVVLAVLACALIPVISNYLVEPYVASVLGMSIQPIRDENLYLSTIIVLFMVVMMFGVLRKKTKAKKASVYLSGVSVDNESRVFLNSLSQPQEATVRNWYMDDWFGEAKLTPIGTIICYILILIAFVWAVVSTAGLTILL
ncbi:NADH-quinone oxidoreductase subunit L [Anaerotardibacter muris]|uniref:NADH-quinone oxidoreductase subunit 5 family protein n=1 Tax=Anaerotardibacter muris TaxID=2941505 RepID=UPI00203BA06E|nr:proton-conducting transporter membrane subunit [Anaerotardibacter muris]